jgi:hypothetical protein
VLSKELASTISDEALSGDGMEVEDKVFRNQYNR